MYLASLLRQLGYHTSTVFKPGYFSFYTSVLAPHSTAQVILTNWAADIQTASNFINPLFTCSGVGVTDPTKPFNLARWCQPALDRKVAQGLRLQAANKPQANDTFSNIDRELVDQAVWLPLIVPKQPSLTSARVGNFQYNPQLGVLLDQLWVR
jgi:peptide/nickel transport system substrate-binding protein